MSPEPVIVLPRPAGWILAGILLLAIVTPSAARVWQLVPGGGDAPSIQAAIDLAAEGDTLDLAPGFYSEPTSVVNKTLLIRGAGMDATSLSGDLDGHTVALRGGNNFTEIRDLTIQDGSAKSLGDLDGGIYGGGVLGEEAFFALVRCRIASNSCESLGGGVYATSVPFQPGSGNTIPRDARAMTRRPTSPRAAGNPAITRDHVLLSDCRIESNFGGSEGGGICMELAWFRIENCRVQGNFAGQGGGISIINSVGEVTGCLIDDNEGLLDGGGIKLDTALALPPPTVRVSHCTIVRNRCDRYGSGVALTSGETIEVTGNLLDGQTGSAFSVIGCANAAIYSGGCNHFGTNASPPVEGCPAPPNDTMGPPLFCNPTALDWRLCSNSPAAMVCPGFSSYRGAFYIGCTGDDCATTVLPTTWSAIKSRVR